MKVPFSLFLSLRYLRPKRTFVSLITMISVLGVVLGVFSLMVVIPIMTGMNIRMRKAILGSEAHLELSRERDKPIDEWVEVLDRVSREKEFADAQPFVRGQAVLDFGNRVIVVRVTGLEAPKASPNAEKPGSPVFTKLADMIPRMGYPNFGKLDLSGDNVLIGRTLAEGMGIGVGDSIVLHSVANGRELLEAQKENREPRNLVMPAELKVTGIYDSGRIDFDVKQVYVPLEIAQKLYDLGGGIHGIQLELANPFEVNRVKRELQAKEPAYRLVSWIDRNKAQFDAVALERFNMYVLEFMVMVVAAFCITNTMITLTTQKRSEIGLMKAVGGPKSQIVGAFLGQGILVGLFGTVAGHLLALVFLIFRLDVAKAVAHLSGIDYASSLLYDLPAKITVIDVAIITGGAMLVCALASLLPACMAARIDAAEALRQEATL